MHRVLRATQRAALVRPEDPRRPDRRHAPWRLRLLAGVRRPGSARGDLSGRMDRPPLVHGRVVLGPSPPAVRADPRGCGPRPAGAAVQPHRLPSRVVPWALPARADRAPVPPSTRPVVLVARGSATVRAHDVDAAVRAVRSLLPVALGPRPAPPLSVPGPGIGVASVRAVLFPVEALVHLRPALLRRLHLL